MGKSGDLAGKQTPGGEIRKSDNLAGRREDLVTRRGGRDIW